MFKEKVYAPCRKKYKKLIKKEIELLAMNIGKFYMSTKIRWKK
jgi:hypothetical protein